MAQQDTFRLCARFYEAGRASAVANAASLGQSVGMAHEDAPKSPSPQTKAEGFDTLLALALEAHLRELLEEMGGAGAASVRLGELGDTHAEVTRLLRVGLKAEVPESEHKKFGLDLV